MSLLSAEASSTSEAGGTTFITAGTLTITATGSSSDGYSESTTGTIWASTTTITAITVSATRSQPAIQTRPFTGQGLLVGTCALPQFTILTFPDGGSIEVPLIGCSDDRPDCCPSLNLTEPEATDTGTAGNQHSTAMSTTGSATSPTASGVISMLSKYPLSVCPSDMVDLDPVCCPIGFSHYGQQIIGNLPCYSTLTTTVYSPDASVLASITSVVAASLASASTTATPTISVIVNQVFALGLPCADENEKEERRSGLSIGAKAGIGAGAGVGALLLILAIVACCLVVKRRRKEKKQDPTNTGPELPVSETIAAGAASGGPEGKHFSAATTMTPGSPLMYPYPQTQPQTQSQMNQYINPHYPGRMEEHPPSHGYSPVFGHNQPPQSQMVQDQYGSIYSIQPARTPNPLHQQQQYPYQYNTSSLVSRQPPGTSPYSPTYDQQPSAPPLQFYSYQRQPQINASDSNQYQYHQQQQQQQQQQEQQHVHHPNISIPVEADSGSSKFQPSSLSTSQPRMSMTTPPVSHDRNSTSQPTSSLTGGGHSAAELSSHDASSQSQRYLINRKSVPG